MLLQNQRVVVIGGSSGVGLAVAKAAIAAGASVTIASRSREKIDRALQAIASSSAEGRVLDAQSEEDSKKFFASMGPFDHLVTTPVVWTAKTRLPDQSTEEFRGLFEVKFWGQYFAAKHAAPWLRKGGSITLSSGQLSHRPTLTSVPRSSVNGAVEALGRALAVELAPLRVNTICAGVIATERWDPVPEAERAAEFARLGRELLVGHIATPEDVAQTYVHAITNRFTTGATLVVEGGALLV